MTGGVYGTDYTYEDGKLTILTQTPLTISGTNVSGTVKVGSGVSANLTFDNLSIKVMTPVTLTKNKQPCADFGWGEQRCVRFSVPGH